MNIYLVQSVSPLPVRKAVVSAKTPKEAKRMAIQASTDLRQRQGHRGNDCWLLPKDSLCKKIGAYSRNVSELIVFSFYE